MSKPRFVLHQPFFEALVAAGILSEAQATTTRRVVIDAEVGAPVRIYIDSLADERLLRIGPKALANVEVVRAPE